MIAIGRKSHNAGMISALLLSLAVCARAEAPRLTAEIDPRLELFGAIQTLAGGGKALPAERDYVTESFGALRAHPAITGYKKLSAGCGRRCGFALAALFLTPPPELDWTKDAGDLPEYFIDNSGRRAEFEAWLKDARDFAAKAGFAERFAARRAAYARYEDSARRELGGRPWLETLEAYVGRPFDGQVRLLLSPTFEPGELSEFIIPYPFLNGETARPGPYRVFAVTRPKPSAGEPAWGLGRPPANALWNEPLNVTLSPALDARAKDLEASAGLFPAVGAECPSPWKTCAKHLVVMAAARRLDAKIFKAESPRHPGSCGDQAIAALAERLRTGYETDRKRFADLPAFLPLLLETLGAVRCAKPAAR